MPLSLWSASRGLSACAIRSLFHNAQRLQPVVLGLVFGASFGAQASALSAADGAQICDDAARLAARETGVPVDVLRAITRTETGRGRAAQPWPWTVNMQGTGLWFETEAKARAYVFKHFQSGARSFDIGCFQINYKWHSQAFRSIEDMFDPAINAIYAARFLTTLYEKQGDWHNAVGAYHSKTPEHATRYKARYSEILARLNGGPQTPQPDRLEPGMFLVSANRQPLVASNLMQSPAAQTYTNGSLLPASRGQVAFIPLGTETK